MFDWPFKLNEELGHCLSACTYGEACALDIPSSRATVSSVFKMDETATRRPTSSFLYDLYRSVFTGISKPLGSFTTLLQKMYGKVLHAVGPQPTVKPSNHTVVWALFAFMFFLVSISLAVRFPTCNVKDTFITTASVIICIVSSLVWRDLVTVSDRKYMPLHI